MVNSETFEAPYYLISFVFLLCVIVLIFYKINWAHTTLFLVLFVYVCVEYLVFQAAPPLPPSPEEALKMQGESGRKSFFLGVRKLLKNRGFILLLISNGLAVAVINSLSTLLNELILNYFPVCMCVIRNLYYWCLNCITASKSWARDTRRTLLISVSYEGWNFNSGNYLFTTDTK